MASELTCTAELRASTSVPVESCLYKRRKAEKDCRKTAFSTVLISNSVNSHAGAQVELSGMLARLSSLDEESCCDKQQVRGWISASKGRQSVTSQVIDCS